MMILNPVVIALLSGSFLISLMIMIASWFGLQIVWHWDLHSGSERQLALEKRTYLVSTLMAYAFDFEILSFFLFIYAADNLHSLFIGAMCAAGSLNAGEYGYLTLGIKGLTLILAGLWLVMNHVDSRARDHPLIRKKYVFLLFLAPLMLAETAFQGAYFLSLKADVITSCCESLFSAGQADGRGPFSMIISLPVGYLRATFYGTAFISLGLDVLFYRGFDKLGSIFSISSTGFFLVSVLALISFICLYFYELPTHHCPFCILQREYSYVGYLLYCTLLGGVISGAGVGILKPFRKVPSLQDSLPIIQRRLGMLGFILNFFFISLVTWQMVCSDLILDH